MISVLRRSWRGTKPNVGAQIDWSKAPPSLVLCFPFNEGHGSPRDYVSGLLDVGPTLTNTFGRTTWRPFGFSMNGGGVAGARPIEPPLLAALRFDSNRSTFAWKQYNRFVGSLVNTTLVFFNTFGGGRFTLGAPEWGGADQFAIQFNIGGTALSGVARSTLVNQWHSLMASFSTGSGVDLRTGMKIWDDGTIVGDQGTCGPTPSMDQVVMVGAPNAADCDYEYWYVFNEFQNGSSDDLAMQLAENPYWFFTDPRATFFSFSFAEVTETPTAETEPVGFGTTDTILVADLGLKYAWSVWPNQDAVSLWRVRNPSTGIEEIFAGGRDGNVRVLNRPSSTNAFTARVRHTSALGAQGIEKSPRHLYLYFKEEGAFTVNVRTYMDFASTASVDTTVSLLGSGSVWGVFVWGTGVWGGQSQIIKRVDLRGTGEFLTLEIESTEAGERFTFLGYEVLWRSRRLVRR